MTLRLYIWVRSDLASLTPGKCAAQVAHAASQAAYQVIAIGNKDEQTQYREWEISAVREYDPKSIYIKDSHEGFGTTIVLDGLDPTTLNQIYYEHFGVSDITSAFYGMVVDPSYPIRDGLVTHSVEALTCVWALLDEHNNSSFLKKYELYNGNRV